MKRLQTIFAALLLLHTLLTASAQTDTITTKPQLKFSLNVNTGLNYYGRTDSSKSSGVFPLLEWWITPTVYVNAAPIFVSNAVQSFEYAGTVATVGYQRLSPKWITSVYITKPFYKESTQLVQSALKAQTGLNLTYRNKILNLNAGGDVKFSDKVDYGTTGGIDHAIRIKNKDNSVLVFDPAFYAYAGTQNFQQTYYKKSNTNFLLFRGNAQQVTENISRFCIMAYEASLPVIYAKGKVMLIATPSYIIPQNLITVTGNPDFSEQGGNMFYATLAAKYSF